MSSSLLSPRTKRSPDSDLIPLINIVFLLLIFFMVAGSIQPSVPIEIERPIVDITKPISTVPIQILLNKQNELYLNGHLLSLEQLQQEIALLIEANSLETSLVLTVSLHVDRQVKAFQLDHLLNVIRPHDIQKITLVTQQTTLQTQLEPQVER